MLTTSNSPQRWLMLVAHIMAGVIRALCAQTQTLPAGAAIRISNVDATDAGNILGFGAGGDHTFTGNRFISQVAASAELGQFKGGPASGQLTLEFDQ
jgi:hypothetical protein